MQASKFFVFSIFLVLSACANELPPAEYVNWVKDYSNGIHKKKEINKIVFDVQYKPSDFILLNERAITTEKDTTFKNKAEALNKLQYFTLKITLAGSKEDFLKYGIQSEKEYYDRLYYYSFNFQNDIYVEEGGNMFPCKLFHFERSYDLTSSRTFVLAFEKTGADNDKTLVIDSKELGLGPVKINFDKEELGSIPELQL